MPFWHVVPPLHFTPHAPQLSLDFMRSTHPTFGQAVVPGSHIHAPETHVPAPQLSPHAPQLFASVLKFAHPTAPPQAVCPCGHWHTPETHEPPAQLSPQEPQLPMSFERS